MAADTQWTDCIMVQHYILSLIKLMPTACILWYQNLQFQESCQHHRKALSIAVFSVQTIDELLANSRSRQVTGASHYSSSCNMTSEQLRLVRASSPVPKAVTQFKWPGRLHTLVSPYVHVLTNEDATKLTTKLHIIKVLSSIQTLITNKTTHLEECLHKHIFLESIKRNLQTELVEQSLKSSLQINWYHKTIANRHNIWNQQEKLNFKV
jgi:hypothetical protein